MANNPNQPGQQQPDRKFPREQDPELEPIDYKDEPPPVVKANAEGEGDDVAQNDNVENEGEGNKTADRKYREGVKRSIKKGNIEQDAKKAEQALDDEDERKDLEDAEEAARKGQIH